jgi:lipopolysaccharide export system permease protein
MRLLQRYIFFELLRLFVFIVSVLTLLLVFVGVFREATERGLGPAQIFQVLPYVAPSMLPFTIPATLLLTVCVVYGRVAGDQEVVATKAAGINVMVILNPALLLAAILTMLSFTLTNHVIPWASRNIESVIAEAGGRIFLDVLKSQHQITDPERGVSITVDDVVGTKLINPVFRKAMKNEVYIVQCQEASLDFDLTNQEVLVVFQKAKVQIPSRAETQFWTESFAHRFPLQKKKTKLQPRAMSIAEIKDQLIKQEGELEQLEFERDWVAATSIILGDFDRLSPDRFAPHRKAVKRQTNMQRKMKTEFHSRFAMAGSCFLFVLLGAPFAILQAKQQFLTNFIMCFIPILLIYYPVMFLMINLSKSGSVEPWWAMWIANILIATIGCRYLYKVIQY